MATITTVQGTNTPNEGRGIWNTNFTNVNAELIANTAAIAGIGGTPVGTTQTQTLTNKTLISNYIVGGTGNTITISRRDLNPGNTLFNVLSSSGSITNIDVANASVYNLTIYGGNGISTSVGSNILYIKNSANCILNEASQKLGVAIAAVSSGNVAQFGGSVLVDGFLAAGADHTAAGAAEVHLFSSSPELRIQTSGTESAITFSKSTDSFVLNSNFTTPGAHYFDISYGGTSLTRITSSLLTITRSTSMTGTTNTFTGDVIVQGTLTAATLSATATNVTITNGPVQISGGTSSIAAGALAHNLLASMTAGYMLIGNGSAVPTATAMSGDVTISSTGVTTIGNSKITLAKMVSQSNNTILGGNGSAVIAMTNGSGDVTFAQSAGLLTFTLGAGKVFNSHINANAEIDIEKTTLTVASGITYSGGELGLTHPISAINPVGTIIAYGGNVSGLAPTGVIEVIPGWLYCNGATVSSGNYPALYSTLGSAWGGSGQLPNLMGAFLRGVDPSGAVDPNTGTRVGGNAADIGSYQADTFESHTHTVGNYSTGQPPGGYIVTGAGQSSVVTTSATGGSETRPLNYGVAYLIKY